MKNILFILICGLKSDRKGDNRRAVRPSLDLSPDCPSNKEGVSMKSTIMKIAALMVLVFLFVDGLDAQRGRAARSSAKTASGEDGAPDSTANALPAIVNDMVNGNVNEIKVSDSGSAKAASGKQKSARLAGQKVDTKNLMKNYVSLGEGNWYHLWGKGIKGLGWVRFDPRHIPETR